MAATHRWVDELTVRQERLRNAVENERAGDRAVPHQLLCKERLRLEDHAVAMGDENYQSGSPPADQLHQQTDHQQPQTVSDWQESSRGESTPPSCRVKYVRGVPTVSKRDIQWNTMFKRLQQFKREYGHCNVPQGYTLDRELATWVKNQRQAYRYMLERKSSKRISTDRITRLNRIGFEWRKNARSVDFWRAAQKKKSAGTTSTASTMSMAKAKAKKNMATPVMAGPTRVVSNTTVLVCNESI